MRERILSEEEMDADPVVVPLVAVPIPLSINEVVSHTPDEINNLPQKQTAMSRARVTRERTYAVISRLLEATKWEDVVDASGNVRRERVPDLDRQRQGAELALKSFGDLVQQIEADVRVTHSVEELLRIYDNARAHPTAHPTARTANADTVDAAPPVKIC